MERMIGETKMEFKVGDKVIVGYNEEHGRITGISENGKLMVRFTESGFSKWCHPISCEKFSDDMDHVYERLKNIETRLRELEEWTREEEERVHKKFYLLEKDIINNAIRYEQSRYAR